MDLIEQIKEKMKSLLSNARTSHGWDHTQRVYNLCVHIGTIEKADSEIVKLAALLHDIGRERQDSSNGQFCHAERGAAIARELLKGYNVDEIKIEKVADCIETHRFRSDKVPRSKEAKILFDADKLDAIGATGIGRAFLFAGEVGAKLHNQDVDIEKTEPYTKEDTAYREFFVKLRKVQERMLTREGKRLAEERHAFMVAFFDRLNKEVEGEL
ncbi:MAG: HD domain-containing protein [Deltaproteobacteria bacterium]|nr:HD domain-containing protein [Deltaproteobacteria bacterium]